MRVCVIDTGVGRIGDGFASEAQLGSNEIIVIEGAARAWVVNIPIAPIVVRVGGGASVFSHSVCLNIADGEVGGSNTGSVGPPFSSSFVCVGEGPGKLVNRCVEVSDEPSLGLVQKRSNVRLRML